MRPDRSRPADDAEGVWRFVYPVHEAPSKHVDCNSKNGIPRTSGSETAQLRIIPSDRPIRPPSTDIPMPAGACCAGTHRNTQALVLSVLRNGTSYGTVGRWESHQPAAAAAGWAVLRRTIVVDKVTGPLGPRRAIATALKQLREEHSKLLSDLSQDLGISTSKLSRLENAQGRPHPRDIRDLIGYYQVDGTPLAERLEGLVEAAQRPGWWTDYDDVVAGTLDAHLAYEVDAVVERVYTIPFIPVLLQTLDYARAIFRDMERRPDREVRRMLEIRLRRQEALRRREGLKPLRLVAVTHETALRQVVGSPGIMREQLDALIESSAASNVDLRVLPFTARPTYSMTCMWAYFQYDDSGESDIVHIETHAGFFSLGDAGQVRKYRAAHDALIRASLSKDGSLELISSVREEMARISLPCTVARVYANSQ